MACINMFNPDGGRAPAAFCGAPPLGPRISFSGDFAVEPPPPNRALSLHCQADPDFEFSVGSHPMMAADQLFSKGRILPLRDSSGCSPQRPPAATTLRDELRGHDGEERASPKGPGRWKELLGLRKAAHCPAAKKGGAEADVVTGVVPSSQEL